MGSVYCNLLFAKFSLQPVAGFWRLSYLESSPFDIYSDLTRSEMTAKKWNRQMTLRIGIYYKLCMSYIYRYVLCIDVLDVTYCLIFLTFEAGTGIGGL